MIEYKTSNMFDDNTEAIVNTVNCVGVMGRGIALQMKKRFPENFKAYEIACKRREVLPGKMFTHETGGVLNPKYIINFPTKRHWRGASRMEDIRAGLADLANVIRGQKIKSISIPPLGCGLGGLDWNVVRSEIETALGLLDGVNIHVFAPNAAPDADAMARNREVPKMTPGRAALVGLIRRYLAGLLDPFITLLEVHKLMYFLQARGELLRLRYAKAPYGPYAENLSHVLNAVEGHLLSGYADGGDAPDKQLNLVPGAEKDAEIFLAQHPETCSRMKAVEELVDGFETPFGLELLATVHWITQSGGMTLDEIVRQTYAWNERKKQFTPRQIELAFNRLVENGWTHPA
jgi:Predicted phosphatase homologous to the C-terminal domain of histone macroH2A1